MILLRREDGYTFSEINMGNSVVFSVNGFYFQSAQNCHTM